eukprot:CAMPEP_0119080812 /NCGR_PEP_ID=MMETSP1178-20130426/113780_1 /TAXON_ID=33656 /ORGANISM="unid sp, Strain CCMP2000" /LENGTH=44 /DNA_ID= /DNA_START= /DNA_END= /DNA_ORIENTATION=
MPAYSPRTPSRSSVVSSAARGVLHPGAATCTRCLMHSNGTQTAA